MPVATVRTPRPDAVAPLDPAFQHQRFLLRQKVLRVSEKYSVWDEEEREILFVHRPVHVGRQLLAILGAFAAAAAVVGLAFALASLLPEARRPIVLVPGFLGGITVAVAVAVLLSAKRHVTFYRDDSQQEVLLRVRQDQKLAFLRVSYTIETPEGRTLARLSKNQLHDFLRKRWNCVAPDGRTLCLVLEDSLVRAVARRVLGPMLGLLRTNFVLLAGEPRREIGRFDRKFTIRDHYVLDLTADGDGLLDRRIALAIGVMLDTGERR